MRIKLIRKWKMKWKALSGMPIGTETTVGVEGFGHFPGLHLEERFSTSVRV